MAKDILMAPVALSPFPFYNDAFVAITARQNHYESFITGTVGGTSTRR